jgi:hypothetical protein
VIQSEQLQEMISFFKLPGGYRESHSPAVKQKIRNNINGKKSYSSPNELKQGVNKGVHINLKTKDKDDAFENY